MINKMILRNCISYILPLVYDESLSYYENVAAVTAKINEIIEEISKIPDEISKALDSEALTEKITNIVDTKLASWWTKTGTVTETDRRQVYSYYMSTVNYFTELLVNQYFTEEGKQVNYVNVPDIPSASRILTLPDIDHMARGFSYGNLNNFKFAYRTNSEKFTPTQLLQECIKEKQVMKTYGWTYVTDSPDYVYGQFSTIPLYNVDNPTEVYNKNGKGTTCATAIANILYRLGYTDLAGDARYTESRVFDYSLPYFLAQNNFIKITDKDELQPGDIVFVNDCLYADERRFNPSHEFVYAGSDLAYDWGNTTLVQNGGTNTIDWSTTLGDQIDGNWYPAIFSHKASLNNSFTVSGNSKWLGIKAIYDDGSRALLYNPDSLKFAEYEQDFSNNQITNVKYEYPIVKTNSWKGGTINVAINYDGTIRLKMYGTLTEALNPAVNDYTIFSFNSFTEKEVLKYINSAFKKYVMFTDSVVGYFWTTQDTTTHDYTVSILHLRVFGSVPVGTELNIYELFYKQ